MKYMSQKIPFELPKPPIYKEKRQLSLHAIIGGCHMNKSNEKLPYLNKSKLSKNYKKRRLK